MSLAYYNEHDAYAAAWLRNLIAAGHIAPGVVDERDIRDIRPEELIGFTQCHFFAGIGIWSHALRRAGWSDDRPIWTGSCPCQPFSAAGRAGGFDDERHLWPHWHWLISQCRPAVVLGEQVASKDGLGWLDLVSADMEGTGYAFGAADLCAAGVGVEWQSSQAGEWLRRAIHDCIDPVVRSMLCDFADWAGAGNIDEGGNHIRQRLYFVGLADADGRDACAEREQSGGQYGQQPSDRGAVERMAHPSSAGPFSRAQSGIRGSEESPWARDGEPERRCASIRMDDDDDTGPQGLAGDGRYPVGQRQGTTRPIAAPGVSLGLADGDRAISQQSARPRPGSGQTEGRRPFGQFERRGSILRDAPTHAADRGGRPVDWLFCRDGKWRAVGSGSFPLVNGAPARVGRLRAYGNALDAETATSFCQVVRELTE